MIICLGVGKCKSLSYLPEEKNSIISVKRISILRGEGKKKLDFFSHTYFMQLRRGVKNILKTNLASLILGIM